LGEDAAQLPETKKVVDLIIDILDARVGNHGGAIAILGEILRCLDENLTGGLRLEAEKQLPGQDSPTEIVDHRVQIRARAIEQFYDRDVDVPKFIWFGCPNTFPGFGRIDPMAWPKPSAFAYEACPCRRREEDLPDPLSTQSQRKDAHVAIVLRDDHVPHVGNLFGGDLRGRRLRATRTIVEGAVRWAFAPIEIPGGGQPQPPESHGKRDSLRGVRDGVQDGSLGGA
jgi:hypothetical protein